MLRQRQRQQSGEGPQQLATEIGEALILAQAEGVVSCARDGSLAFLSPSAARLLGLPANTKMQSSLFALLRDADESVRLRFQSALLDAEPREWVAPRPQHDDAWMEVRSLPLSSGTAFLLRDVTEQERSERQIRRRERRVAAANRSLRLAHKAARAASWEWRPGHALRWLDVAAARALVGRPAEWIEGDELADWRSLVPAEDEPAIEAGFRQVREAGEATFRFRVAGPDGELHWLEASAAVTQRGADGAPTLVSGVTVNIDAAKAAEAHQLMLIDELNHRVKNMLATVQSVARQSLTAAAPIAARNFEERLLALAWTYEVLTDAQWVGANLDEVLSRTLSPHARTSDRRLTLTGPVVLLTPNQALAIAMAAHELATNAVKYGALAGASAGRVEIDWRLEHGRLQLTWREVGGPPVTPPQRRGFGSRLVERALARELGGTATLSFPVEGLVCYLDAPLGPD